jgi:hypothetical protein
VVPKQNRGIPLHFAGSFFAGFSAKAGVVHNLKNPCSFEKKNNFSQFEKK